MPATKVTLRVRSTEVTLDTSPVRRKTVMRMKVCNKSPARQVATRVRIVSGCGATMRVRPRKKKYTPEEKR